MLVQTDFMKPAGEGTPVFSKNGALNRYNHHIFLERNFESSRVKTLQKIPEELQGENEFLPKILWTHNERLAAEELAKLLDLQQERNHSELDDSKINARDI